MEPIGENHITITAALFREGMDRVWRENLGRTVRRTAVTLGILWGILAGVTLAGGKPAVYVLIELAIFALSGLWMTVAAPRRNTRLAWRRLEAGGRLTRVIRFYANHLDVVSGERTVTLPYEDVQRVLYSQHLAILVCRDRVGILLSRDGFLPNLPVFRDGKPA